LFILEDKAAFHIQAPLALNLPRKDKSSRDELDSLSALKDDYISGFHESAHIFVA
jgi:hypothetical protein